MNIANGTAVYQLDPSSMNVIYVPVQRILPSKKKEEYLNKISKQLTESGYKHILLAVMDD